MLEMEEMIQTEEAVATEAVKSPSHQLVLYNDDVNTFDDVIDALVKICQHNLIQAEQCTLIVHHNGKCGVKLGDFKKLKPLAEAFHERGIEAKIEPQ